MFKIPYPLPIHEKIADSLMQSDYARDAVYIRQNGDRHDIRISFSASYSEVNTIGYASGQTQILCKIKSSTAILLDAIEGDNIEIDGLRYRVHDVRPDGGPFVNLILQDPVDVD